MNNDVYTPKINERIVSREEFYATIGNKDITVHGRADVACTVDFRHRNGPIIGRSFYVLNAHNRVQFPTETIYILYN